VNRSAQEHLVYIQEKVNPILEALVTGVLLERPEDPAFFMLKWLCEQTKSLDGSEQQGRSGITPAEEIKEVREEIKRLKERKANLLAMKSNPNRGEETDKSTKADEEEADEDEDDEEDDVVDVMPTPPQNMNRGPRQSVSAEAYGVWNQQDSNFKAPVYEKTPDQKARIEACLEPSFLFRALEKAEMTTIVMAFKEKAVEPGDRFIEQGADGESMFLIESGTADCTVKADGEEKVVKTAGAGDVVGELALLYNCPRAATVTSKEKMILWELDRETFNRIVKGAAAKKRNTYTEFLKKVPLFSNIDQYELMTVADAMKLETYEAANSLIIKQGDAGDKFFVTLEGDCIAKKAFIAGGQEQEVMTHKVGDYFGELSLIKNEPRAASVYTAEPNAKLLYMDRKTFKRLLGPIEDILQRQAKRYDLPAEGQK